jgi:hypothetical protein
MTSSIASVQAERGELVKPMASGRRRSGNVVATSRLGTTKRSFLRGRLSEPAKPYLLRTNTSDRKSLAMLVMKGSGARVSASARKKACLPRRQRERSDLGKGTQVISAVGRP